MTDCSMMTSSSMALSDKDGYARKYKLDYILQDARVDDLTEQQLLREEVINRVMSFRGRGIPN
ncbi:hypothetical protein EON65_07210 [archaeon]|nr:MAG: hypothetical protein EON65_07210 [archaeon]